MTAWGRLAVLGLGAFILAAVLADRLFPPDLSRADNLSLAVLARDGGVLDVLTTSDGFYRLPATVADVDPAFISLLLATEDKRFWVHPGIDPLAMARAIGQFITHGHVVSGGSTITMQVARLLWPHRHTLPGKCYDIARALQLEAHYSKPRILGLYLTLAPYGGNIEGIRAASLMYFQTEPAHLTLAEAALLVALPRSPARLRPDRHQAAARAAARLVLARALLPVDLSATALPPLARHPFPVLAPHLAERLQGEGLSGLVTTTLDSRLQRALAQAAARELPWLGDAANIAALVVDNRSRNILAYLGGADLTAPGGMVDMVRATRSPGSTLKPFIYGIALDDALIVPDSLIDDAPLDADGYAPQDFDKSYHGMVTARAALQQSYNLPAVRVLRAIGPARFAGTLRAAGARLILPGNTAPTLPIALGGVGISLSDLAMLYTGLADGGQAGALRIRAPDVSGAASAPDVSGAASATTPEMTPKAAAAILAMLRGAPLPAGVAPGGRDIAYKTGTSYGFRDAWAAGVSPDTTIIVWVGRTDGTPRPGAYGRLTAAPLLFRFFGFLPADTAAWPPTPVYQAPALAVFNAPHSPPAFIRRPPQITFPPADAILQATDDGAPVPLSLEAAGGTPPYRWVVNGALLPPAPPGMSMSWQPAGPGFAHIAVLDKNDLGASEDIKLQ